VNRRAMSALLLLVLLAAACGQKAGVSQQAATTGGPAAVAAGNGDLGEPTVGVGDTSVTTVAGSTGSTGSGGGSSTGGAAAGSTGTTAPASSGGAPPAGDRTGITDTVIKIGLHAPVTGAAPVPQQAFERGLPVYWNFVVRTMGGVFGRRVQIVFRDDQFNPAAAVRACREMVEQEKVFLLIGAAGADQITACAKYASGAGVPYISAGVNQAGLAGLRGYFAGSQTYLQQNPMLAQLAKRTTQNNKFAVVIEDTPTFQESKASILAAARAQGLQVVYDRDISKNASQAEILTISSQLRASGADVVYFLGPPTALIPLAQQGQSQGYVPAYIGPGLSNGLNLVTAVGCPGLSKSLYLSPFPGLDAIDRLDANYRREYRAQTGSEPDDLGIALWGLNKSVHQFFNAAGKDMTRQSFVQALETGRVFASNVFPPVQYSARNHFGAASSHLLRADCNARQWKTAATFVNRF
jgi:branched-chain amino acid transport system substrate-binding protein